MNWVWALVPYCGFNQIRSAHAVFDRAEKLANEAPVKMLGPLLIFIFPAVLIILLVPILRESFSSFFLNYEHKKPTFSKQQPVRLTGRNIQLTRNP